MNIRTFPIAAALAALFIAPVVLAQSDVASFSSIEGTVMVNQGEQFVPAQPFQPLREGDRVMAGADSSSVVTFADGCDLIIDAQTIVTIPGTSTCGGGFALVQTVTPASGTAVGATAATAAAGNTTDAIVIGSAALLAVAAIALDDDADSAPVVPVSP
jgi:hypothetical protein